MRVHSICYSNSLTNSYYSYASFSVCGDKGDCVVWYSHYDDVAFHLKISFNSDKNYITYKIKN